MPQGSWSKKRERQLDHIRDGLEQRGASPKLAEVIAAHTVNNERARSGESDESSSTSLRDISSVGRALERT